MRAHSTIHKTKSSNSRRKTYLREADLKEFLAQIVYGEKWGISAWKIMSYQGKAEVATDTGRECR